MSTPFTVRLHGPLRERLDEQAEREGLSRNQIVTEAIEARLGYHDEAQRERAVSKRRACDLKILVYRQLDVGYKNGLDATKLRDLELLIATASFEEKVDIFMQTHSFFKHRLVCAERVRYREPEKGKKLTQRSEEKRELEKLELELTKKTIPIFKSLCHIDPAVGPNVEYVRSHAYLAYAQAFIARYKEGSKKLKEAAHNINKAINLRNQLLHTNHELFWYELKRAIINIELLNDRINNKEYSQIIKPDKIVEDIKIATENSKSANALVNNICQKNTYDSINLVRRSIYGTSVTFKECTELGEWLITFAPEFVRERDEQAINNNISTQNSV